MATETKSKTKKPSTTKKNKNGDIIHSKEYLTESYKYVRELSGILAGPLEIEDYVIQSMPDVSPTKWHLAHTSWFFETFILSKAVKA